MTKKQFDFIGKRKWFLLFAALVLVAGLIVNIILGTELDINFKGGAIFSYSLSGEVDQAGLTAIAKEHLGNEVEASFSKDVSGENTQVTFTLVKVPSTVLTYSVTGTADVAAITASAKEVFQCETKVDYDKGANLLTVDPSEIVTDKMVSDFTAALASDKSDAPKFTLTSSNTVNELADAILTDMITKYGTSLVYTVKDAKGVDTAKVKTELENALLAGINTAAGESAAKANVTVTADEKANTLTIRPTVGSQTWAAADVSAITTALQGALPKANASLQSETHNAIGLVTSNSVKATVGKGFFIKCLFAMILGGIFLTLYIGIRFRKIGGVSAGLFATFALIHDILISYLVYVVFRIPLNDNFIAVVLTILGYSINGTIVIYDRIRENGRKFGSTLTVNEIVNRSVNETFTRNVFTSLSTFIAIVTIAVVAKLNGLDSIISFAFPMAVGIIAGFYSSVLLSSPSWAWWRTRRLKKAEEK